MNIKKKFTTAQIAVLVTVATLGSNVLGFVREMILANYFGTGMITDAYVMGISIPTTLLAAVFTAMGTAYMPILAGKFENQGVSEANKITSQLFNFMLLVVGALYLISLIFSKQLVHFFAPGFLGEKQVLTIYYMRFAFLTLFFVSGSTFCDAYLKYRGIFSLQKFIAISQNVFAILFIILAVKIDHHLMIVGLVIGYGVTFAGQAWLTFRKGYTYTPDFHLSGPVKEVLVLALPVFIGGSFSVLNTFIDKMLASGLVEGSVTALNYSGKLITLLMTFTVGTFTTIIYPKLNQAFAQGDLERISNMTERGINLLSVISVPFTFGAMLYAKELVQIVYERGAFGSSSTTLVATTFFFYALRIPFYAVNEMVNRTFYSLHDTKTTVYCSVAAVFVNIGLNLMLVGPMGAAGLALATSVAELVGMLARWISFRKKHGEITLLRSKRKLCLVVLFSLLSVAISYVVYRALAGLSILILRLLPAVGAACLVYLGLLYVAKFEELGIIRDLIK